MNKNWFIRICLILGTLALCITYIISELYQIKSLTTWLGYLMALSYYIPYSLAGWVYTKQHRESLKSYYIIRGAILAFGFGFIMFFVINCIQN